METEELIKAAMEAKEHAMLHIPISGLERHF